MFTASVKKRENIAEYLLYMWQIEDLIRAYGLDMDRIDAEIVEKHTSLTDEQKRMMHEWYESLVDMMRREGVAAKGHLQLNRNVLIDLRNLHSRLISNPKFADYAAEYYKTLPYVVELRAKAGDDRKDEIETCFDALYGIMLLRMQGKEISAATLGAMRQISRYLALLSHYYKLDYNNELKEDND